jgi:hypothetical protein
MAQKQITDWLRRFHYRVDPEARVIDCFRVEVLDMHVYVNQYLYTGGHPDRPAELKQLWNRAVESAKFLQDSFAQRDWRQYGLRGPNDLRPFAVIIGCENAREQVKHQIKLDMLCYESNAQSTEHSHYVPEPNDHIRRVRYLDDIWGGLEWLEMN